MTLREALRLQDLKLGEQTNYCIALQAELAQCLAVNEQVAKINDDLISTNALLRDESERWKKGHAALRAKVLLLAKYKEAHGRIVEIEAIQEKELDALRERVAELEHIKENLHGHIRRLEEMLIHSTGPAIAAEREACARTIEAYEGFTPDERRIAAAAIRARKP